MDRSRTPSRYQRNHCRGLVKSNRARELTTLFGEPRTSQVGGWRVPLVEEGLKRRAEPIWLLPMDDVTAVVEADQLAVFQQRGGGGSVRDGEDGVARSPEDPDGWKLGDLRDAVEEVPRLAPPTDDVAHGARERAGAARLAQVGSQQGDLGPRIAGGGARHGEAGDRAHPALAERVDHERHGGDPQPRKDLTPQAAGRNQAQASDPGAALQQQPLSNPASVRMTDEIQIPEVELLDPASDLRGVPVERVRRVGSA